jgi:uncharacterized protein
MPIFFCKLNAPRPRFAFEMTSDEMALMQEHSAHWQRWRASGHVRAFGLVADPAGPYGIGIVEFETEADVRQFIAADPTILSNRGFRFDVFPMPLGA